MKTALRTGAVAASALLASATLTGFTTIPISGTQRIDWLYERLSATPESGAGAKVKLDFGDYSVGSGTGTTFDATDGLPKEKTGVFSLLGARGAGSTSADMPGLNDLLIDTHAAVSLKSISGTYSSTTKNADLSALSAVVPNTFAASVAKALPEGRNILDNPTFKPVADSQANLIMKPGTEATRVWASFVMEGAGHKNSFGYFIYNPNCPPKHRSQVRAFKKGELISSAKNPYGQGTNDKSSTVINSDCEPGEGTTSEIIVLPNASQDRPLPRAGNANVNTSGTGPTAYLGEIPAGMAMGFLIVSNGWTQTGNKENKPGTSKSQSTEWIFYSLSDLNPERRGVQTVGTRTYDDLTKHVILLKDGNLENYPKGYHRFALGFEDLNRNNAGADNDFNDLVMMLHVEKKEILSNVTVTATETKPEETTELVKSVADVNTNANTVVHYPGATTWATLAFEDLWPAAPSGFFYNSVTATQADYDFNDLVVKYRSSQTLVNNRITQIDLTYRLDARGAKNKNGFAVQLTGVKPADVQSIIVTDPDGVSTTLGLGTNRSDYKLTAPALHAYVGAGDNASNATLLDKAIDAGSNQLTIRLFNNAYEWLPVTTCSEFYNTLRTCPVESSKTFTVQIKLKGTGFEKVAGLTPPYNPYIFNYESPSKEVHLPNFSPTRFGKDNSSFGTLQDNTDKTSWKKTYVTADGRPWALHIPYEWDHPQESNRIGDVFGGFKPWVESAGANNTDWYTKPTVTNTFRGTRKFPK